MKQITLPEILTPKEIARALKLYKSLKGTGRFNATVVKEVIEPVLARINAATGQENDARYLGYAVEYVFSEATHDD